jgi:phosphoserine aminotransferase
MVPYNLMNKKAAYLETGGWAQKAIKEGKFFGEVIIAGSSADKNFTYIPKYTLPTDADYFHITTNNTLYGTEILYDIDSPVPLVADMSSDILSRPVDISIPSMLDYRTHIKENSLYNTPPCSAIFTVKETLKWLKSIGGLEAIQKLNNEKARLLYDEIERNKLFTGTADKDARSIMNICFVMKEPYKQLEEEFQKFASSKGMVGVKGHRSVGGFRASTYNALPIESVKALIDCMQEFEKMHP